MKKRELFKKLKDGYIINKQRDQKISEEFSYSDYELEKNMQKVDEAIEISLGLI